MADSVTTALLRVQQEMPLVLKKSSKGHHSNYTSLEEIIERVRPILNNHGLVLIQTGVFSEDGSGFFCRTTLQHISGQSIEGVWKVCGTKDAKLHPSQAVGQGWTYARRYSLAAILGLGTGDHDVDSSEPPTQEAPKAPSKIAAALKESSEDRTMTDEERERFIAKVEEMGGDVDYACQIDKLSVATNYIAELNQTSQRAKE